MAGLASTDRQPCRVAYFNLEEYESAKASFEAAQALEARRDTATWIRKCDAEIQGVPLAVLRLQSRSSVKMARPAGAFTLAGQLGCWLARQLVLVQNFQADCECKDTSCAVSLYMHMHV